MYHFMLKHLALEPINIKSPNCVILPGTFVNSKISFSHLLLQEVTLTKDLKLMVETICIFKNLMEVNKLVNFPKFGYQYPQYGGN